jgi:hypothetical protein
MAVEKMMLSKLDQNTSYDFLDGQTPAQISQQLKDQKKSTTNSQHSFPLLTAKCHRTKWSIIPNG